MDEWAMELPGSPSIVRSVRRWVREVLEDFPDIVEDMMLIASEYATNCVRHSVAADGQTVSLKIERHEDRLRLEVSDGGARADREHGWTEEEAGNFGRGLRIVAILADDMGDEVSKEGRLAWAEMKV